MLILVAPGETQADVDKVFIGQTVSAFTQEGIEQMQDAAQTLSVYDMDQIFCSDLYRAQRFMEGIAKANHHDAPQTLVEELRERSGGDYEGRRYTDIRKGMSPKQYKVWERDPFEAPEQGESLADVQERVKPWFDSEVYPLMVANANILIVSHPDTIRVLIALARGDDLGEAIGVHIEPALPIFYYHTARSS